MNVPGMTIVSWTGGSDSVYVNLARGKNLTQLYVVNTITHAKTRLTDSKTGIIDCAVSEAGHVIAYIEHRPIKPLELSPATYAGRIIAPDQNPYELIRGYDADRRGNWLPNIVKVSVRGATRTVSLPSLEKPRQGMGLSVSPRAVFDRYESWRDSHGA
jgi:hypothetical protein